MQIFGGKYFGRENSKCKVQGYEVLGCLSGKGVIDAGGE